MIRKIALFICLFLVILVPIAVADPSLVVTDYQFTPKVLIPGDEGYLQVTIKNAETTATEATTYTWSDRSTTYTDTMGAIINKVWISSAVSNGKKISVSNNFEDLCNLAPATSIPLSFKINSDKDISEGMYFLTMHVDVEGYPDLNYEIPINVSNKTVDLISTYIPSTISISGSTDITLSAVNNLQQTVKNVRISPESVDSITFSPESYVIGDINADSSQEATFSIKPADLGEKQITFNLSFKNGNNQHYKLLNFNINVIDTLDVAPVLYNIPISIQKGSSARVRLEVYNAKTTSITGVIVTPITDLKIVPSQYFIGAMDPDDVFTANFDLYSEGVDVGNHSISFKVSFKQDEEYFVTPSISSSFKIIEPIQGEDGTGLIAIASISIIIVIIILSFVIMKRRRQKK